MGTGESRRRHAQLKGKCSFQFSDLRRRCLNTHSATSTSRDVERSVVLFLLKQEWNSLITGFLVSSNGLRRSKILTCTHLKLCQHWRLMEQSFQSACQSFAILPMSLD